jgi:hypothetical protein
MQGLQGRVFDGTAQRPRKDLLLWGREIEAAAAAADVACGNGVSSAADVAEAGNGAPAAKAVSNRL